MSQLQRREFLEMIVGASAVLQAGQVLAADVTPQDKSTTSPAAAKPHFGRRLKLGVIGCGGRGSWIAKLFQEHGGYELVSLADYFPDRALNTGKAVGVPAERCFSGLSGYLRVMESGVEAVALEALSYFFPQHAAAALDAGLHIYMAKPVAVDAPGTIRIGKLGEQATEKKRVFHVDYQMPTDPANIEVVRRVNAGALGELQAVWSLGYRDDKGFDDPPLTANIESRIVSNIWVNDDALGGGYLGNYDIHVIDALVWALGRRPVKAMGTGRRCRPSPHGDSLDTYSVIYTFDDGLGWCHQAATGPGHEWLSQGSLEGSIQGRDAGARLSYYKKACVRGGPQHMGAKAVEGLYAAGARRNIAEFYEQVIAGRVDNDTVKRAVDGTLTAVLGREAVRRGSVTLSQLLRENKALELNLRGLKA